MKLAVLFGGISSEHDISCLSAASILRNLNKDKYEIYPVGITRDGEWFYCPDCDPDRVESGAWERMTGKVKVVLAPDRGMHGMVLLREEKSGCPSGLRISGAARRRRRGRHDAGSARTGRHSVRRLRRSCKREHDG
ncbi:MAG: hypothetical protein ACLSDM_02080 [Butyricicoccus sp.]